MYNDFSAQAQDDTHTPMFDMALACGADKIERLLAGMCDVGWLEAEVHNDTLECSYRVTDDFLVFAGLL
jgi:hypothetical protein